MVKNMIILTDNQLVHTIDKGHFPDTRSLKTTHKHIGVASIKCVTRGV
jgi:hypothetical protein